MKKISRSNLAKLVKENNLEVTRNKASVKSKQKNPEMKSENPDLSSGLVVTSASVVSEMATALAASSEKVSNSSVMVAQIVQAIQRGLTEKPNVMAVSPKKKKWRFTPVRGYDQLIQHIDVEEL